MALSSKRWIVASATGGILLVAAIVLFAAGVLPGRGRGGERPRPVTVDEDEDGPETPLTGVHPRRDASLTVSVQQILSVEPLFEADVRAQVTGVVRSVPKGIGDRVSRDELLVSIDVPDVADDVQQKQAVIRQRETEVRLAEARVENSRDAIEVAKLMLPVSRAQRDVAVYTRDYRKLVRDRYQENVRLGGINQTVADEEQRNYLAAVSAVEVAEANILKSQADVKEKESALRVAQTDVELKKSLAEVARRERDLAQAKLDFASIRAPFDGVITTRIVQPGELVQNSSSGQSRWLMTLSRTDIVTLVMKVPDTYAPYVTKGTEAVIRIDELPGVTIRGKVTRASSSILNKDRTLRVEVDLFNGSPQRYGRLAARCANAWLAPLGAADPLQAATLSLASREAWSRDCRSLSDPFPMLPEVSGHGDEPVRLLPGMSGYMRLNLREFRDVSLIPASAVYSYGGKPYILVAEPDREEKDVGVTRQLPVRVQVTDGKVSKVVVIVQEGDPLHGKPEKQRELSPDETVILSRQVEVGAGRKVRVTLQDW
jgi:multidrug resistance efflux pump